MDAIAKLLNELKDEYEQLQNQPDSPQQPQKKSAIASTSGDDGIDRLLSEVKADFAQKDLAQELQKQQQLEQLQAQQLAELQQKAEDWLAKLDPFSPEGLWFERFAERYDSKLAAALDYLQNK